MIAFKLIIIVANDDTHTFQRSLPSKRATKGTPTVSPHLMGRCTEQQFFSWFSTRVNTFKNVDLFSTRLKIFQLSSKGWNLVSHAFDIVCNRESIALRLNFLQLFTHFCTNFRFLNNTSIILRFYRFLWDIWHKIDRMERKSENIASFPLLTYILRFKSKTFCVCLNIRSSLLNSLQNCLQFSK